MSLTNGPKVSAVNYGSQAHFKGVDTTMNGGILGLTQTFYKGNFWTALTAGFRWSLGKEGNPIEKVQRVNEQKVSQHPTTWPKSPQTISQDKKAATRTDSPITPTKLTLLSRADLLARANNTLKTPAERKIVKQLSSSQKITYGSKPQNTTRTTYRATIKQL